MPRFNPWEELTEDEVAAYAAQNGLRNIPEDLLTDDVVAAWEDQGVAESLTRALDVEVEFATGEGYSSENEYEYLHERLRDDVSEAVDSFLGDPGNHGNPLYDVLSGFERDLVRARRGQIVEELSDSNLYTDSDRGTFETHIEETEISIYFEYPTIEKHRWDLLTADEVEHVFRQSYIGDRDGVSRQFMDSVAKKQGIEAYAIVGLDRWFGLQLDEDRAIARVEDILGDVEAEELEEAPGAETVWTFPAIDQIDPTGAGGRGWKVDRLSWVNLAVEGATMGHCIGQERYGYPQRVRSGNAAVYSLRTESGKPKFTIFQNLQTGVVEQVKGKANRLPEKPLERALLTDFLQNYLGTDPSTVKDMQGRANPSGKHHCGFCARK